MSTPLSNKPEPKLAAPKKYANTASICGAKGN